MVINKLPNLPTPGPKFRATTGLGSFAKKLKSASRYGELRNIQDNLPAIEQAVKKYERYIKWRGGLTNRQKQEAWRNIKESDKKVTAEDKKDIKKILGHLGKKPAERQNIASVPEKNKKIFPGLFSFKKEEKKKKIPYYLQASAADESEISRRTGISIHDSRGGASRVSVDTRAQGGKINSSINPISGGVSLVNKNQKPAPARPNIPLVR